MYIKVLWNVYGECDNYNVLEGHKNAVLDLEWNPSGSKLVSCSADKTVGVWDTTKGVRTKKYTGHSAVVNAVNVSRGASPVAVSGSDDCLAMVWDLRSRTRCDYRGMQRLPHAIRPKDIGTTL